MVDRQIVLVPRGTYIPPGLEDVVYEAPAPDEDSLGSGAEAGSTLESLPIPQNFRIISQTIRRNKDGSQVVDVVAETDDMPGVLNIDVRVTKL